MRLLDFVKPVSTWSPGRVRDYLAVHHPDSLTLLDVRQAAEYRGGHLPGAVHIPLDELPERLDELDRERPTIVYCASGLRSHAAAAFLGRAGFGDVHQLAGGLRAWADATAAGSPVPELERFARLATPEEHAALAWQLEENTRAFYTEAAGLVGSGRPAQLLLELAAEEQHHKGSLQAVYEGLTARPAPADFPRGVLAAPPEDLLEGGLDRREALAWVRDRGREAAAEVAMTIEVSALDRYLYLHRHLPDENSRRIFEILADEERRHLKRLARLLEAEQ